MTIDLAPPIGDVEWHEARHVVHRVAEPLPAERVALTPAISRVLAADVLARQPVPSFTASAMDGWAVAGPGPWQVVGRSAAGWPYERSLASGAAVGVCTGAAVPTGSDAVVRAEDGLEIDGTLWAVTPPPCGADIRRAGEELDAGAVLAEAGTTVTPALAGLAASTGVDELPVRRQPQVSVLALGDELLARGPARNGQVRDALGVQMTGWVGWLGGHVAMTQFVPDRLVATVSAIEGAVADIVITTGGSSVGEHDHVRAAIHRLGGRLIIDRVAVRPGHPMLLAALSDGRWLVGLPGNPGAAIAAILTLLRPLIAGLLGQPEPETRRETLDVDVAGARVHRIIPAVVVSGRVHPTGHDGSAMLSGWATASCGLVVRPGGMKKGSSVATIPLPHPQSCQA